MIYRLRYCNKEGIEARIDIQKGLATPVIEVEGTERPFILSYNNDKGNKSGMFLTSSADIEIYETPDFNIDNLKTSNETELAVTHYINNVVSWQGFIIPDFFSIEVRNNPVITMTASDRLGTLKNVTLSDLPSMISLRELAILCLNKTGLSLPLRTMADFNNGTGVNDFFNSKILTQRLSDTKGRSISCYDILSSILTASNSFLVQRSGAWHIINKIQHEAGSGKLYTGATSFINWSDVIFNFSDISTGGRRTIVPVASTVGVFHEFGGGRLHPDNYDFLYDLTGWNSVGGFVATIDNRKVDTFTTGGTGQAEYKPVYGAVTEKKYLVNFNEYLRNENPIYLESNAIPIFYSGSGSVTVSLDINAVGPAVSSIGSFPPAYLRVAIIATNGTKTKTLDYSGKFIDYPSTNPPVFTSQFDKDEAISPTIYKALSKWMAVSGALEVEDDLSLYSLKIRIYGGGGGRTVLINSVGLTIKSESKDNPKGIIYKVEREDNYTKAHEINTSLFADYLTTGLNGYFYDYSIDDTSSLYNSANELTSKWTAYNDTEQLPLLQHITRQRSRLFSVAHDLLSAEIEVSNFDPLAIFVACEKRYTVVSAQFDFFKSNLSVELEEVAFQSANVRDFIYSYFGDGESGIKSVGGISGGSGGGGTGGGLTPEQIEILSFWKKDPDNPNTIYTEMNAYSKMELSAYGAGDGGGGGGIIETVYGYGNLGQTFNNGILTDTFNAYTINQINTRLVAVEGGSATTVNTTGTGNAITSISKSGTVITASKDLTFSLSGHTHPISDITNLQTTLNSKLETSIFNTHNTDNVRHITGAERTKWDGVVTDFGNLEIGGRNLLLNSGVPVTNSNYPTKVYNLSPIGQTLVDGEDVTVVIKGSLGAGKNSFRLYNSGGSVYAGATIYPSEFIDGVAIKTFKWSKLTAYNTTLSVFPFPSTVTVDSTIEWIKLVRGNKTLTDWTPAPEDQVSDWLTTDINSFSFIKNKPTLLSQFTDNIGVATHIANNSNPHSVTKAQVGLGNVDNTSDLLKPISNATQAALNLKLDKSIFDDLFEKVEVSTGVFAIKAKYDFFSIGEVSAYGLGTGGSGGGSYDRLDAWADYDSTKSGWVLSALLGNDLNTRVGNLEGGSALTVNTTGTGNAITSLTKSGTVITATKGATFSLDNHLHTGVYEPVFTKNSAFNKNFGTTSGTVAQGNDSRIINGQTAFSWGNHASAGYALNSSLSNYLPLAGGTLTGNLTAPIFVGALNGNASTATKLQTARTIAGVSFDGTANIAIPFANLSSKPTTLSGYGITDAYTKAEVDSLASYVGGYNFTNGFLIKTNVARTENSMLVLHIKGNSYGGRVPINTLVQVYNYVSSDSIILTGALNNGYAISEVKVFYYNNLVYFWVPQQYFYMTMTFQLLKAKGQVNRVDSVTNAAVPESGVEKMVTITPRTAWFEDTLANLSQLTDDIGVATHIANKSNPHNVTKAQVGLGNVDNTADSAKNVLSATKLTTARTIAGVEFDGTANIAIPFANLSSKPTTLGGYGIIDAVTLNTAQTISGEKTFSGTVTAPTFVGSLSGNAATATKLRTARTIWGQSFDGTGNISGALSGATTIAASISVTSPKVIFNAAGWSMEQVGSELQMKHNNVVKMRFTSTGSIVATEEITAFG